jgi:hypothetical protein
MESNDFIGNNLMAYAINKGFKPIKGLHIWHGLLKNNIVLLNLSNAYQLTAYG